MKTVRLAGLARLDVIEAHEWYEQQRAGLGGRFGASLDRVLRHVGESPRRFPMVHGEVRRAVVGRFPFGVFFVELEAYVRVVAVVHLRRHPEAWKRRG